MMQHKPSYVSQIGRYSRTSTLQPTDVPSAAVSLRRPALGDIGNVQKPTSSLGMMKKPSESILPRPVDRLSSLDSRAPLATYRHTSELPVSRPLDAYLARPRVETSKPMSFESIPSFTAHKPVSMVKTNPNDVDEYVEDIMAYLREKEQRDATPSTYMTQQEDLSEKMRTILIDWLSEVHAKFRLNTETFFLAIRYVDRYLSIRTVSRSQLQLVGIVALLLASKIEEIYAPGIQDLIKICNNAYKKDEIIRMERYMLQTLSYNMGSPTPYHFIARLCKVGGLDSRVEFMAYYFAELSLLEYKSLRHLPSMIASSALLLAKTMNGNPGWSSALEHASKYSESSLQGCFEELVAIRRDADVSTYKGIRTKYCNIKMKEVARIPVPTNL